MRLTLRQLQVFVAIADHGSTTAAGQAIALSQSASSAALQELEAHFGTPLFDRIGRRLALNGHGRALLEPARSLLVNAADLERQLAAGGDPSQGHRCGWYWPPAPPSAITCCRRASPSCCGMPRRPRSTFASTTVPGWSPPCSAWMWTRA